MTAATQDFKGSDKVGSEATPPPPLLALPIEANTIVYGGTMAASNAAGRAVPPTSSSALFLWGRVERQVDNRTSNPPFGAAGAQKVTIKPGVYYFLSDGSVSAADVGKAVYAADDLTVTLNAAGASYWLPFAGIVQPPGLGPDGVSPAQGKVPVYVGFPGCTGQIFRGTVAIPLATIQAQTSATAFNVGPVLPTNARLIEAEINVLTAISGGSISAVTATLQGGTDAAGSIIASTSVFTGASPTIATPGSNPYAARGGQQLKMTLTSTGGALSTATAGSLSVDVFYTIVP